MAGPVYKRVLIKISGEALSGGKGTGFDFGFVSARSENAWSSEPRWR